MPIITFTEDQRREATLPTLENAHPGEITIHIEDAGDCDGVPCGERLEAALSAEEYANYLECHPERPPLGPHSHLVYRGINPDTRRRVVAVVRR